jgi:hypothetical protein
MWDMRKLKIEAWSIFEWSKYVNYLAIMKDGLESDKVKLPEVKQHNGAHRRPRK